RRRTRRPVPAAAVAVRQLGHRGHDGRRPPDAGDHRPGPDHQGRGLLPRPPRLGPGLRLPRGRRGGPRGATRPHPPHDPHPPPARFVRLTLVAGFNDLDCVARLLDEHPDEIAGMIIEPIMMNAGIIHPEPGYLAALKELLHAHGALLAFDEVKTGLTAGPAGATGLTGVVPDITCLAKAIGGG